MEQAETHTELAKAVNPQVFQFVQSLAGLYPPREDALYSGGDRQAASGRSVSPVQVRSLSPKSGRPLPVAVSACWLAPGFSIAGRGD